MMICFHNGHERSLCSELERFLPSPPIFKLDVNNFLQRKKKSAANKENGFLLASGF